MNKCQDSRERSSLVEMTWNKTAFSYPEIEQHLFLQEVSVTVTKTANYVIRKKTVEKLYKKFGISATRTELE